MKYIKMFAMVSLICCGLSSTSRGMEELPCDNEQTEEISFRSLAESIGYLELLNFMEHQSQPFFDCLVENFKKNDVVEISRKNKAPFSVDIRDILVLDVLIQVAAQKNLENLAGCLIDRNNDKDKKHNKAVAASFESGLTIAMQRGSGPVIALIIEKFYVHEHFEIPKILVKEIGKIFITNNHHLAKKLFDNQRFWGALHKHNLLTSHSCNVINEASKRNDDKWNEARNLASALGNQYLKDLK